MEHGAVNSTGIVKKFFCDLLKEEGLSFGHWSGEVKISHFLFLTIIWWDVLRWSGIVLGRFVC